MKFLRHLVEQPFIAATGFAALIHSTWALGTLFGGTQPYVWSVEFLAWLIPALLIAFSLDVGQISTSMKIREHGLKVGNGAAFVVIALFTYYLQFLHLAHHMPDLPLAAGISESHRQAALWLRDFAIWLIPALLPLSTLLYTFSSDEKAQPKADAHPEPRISIETPEKPMLEEKSNEIAVVDIELIPQAVFAAHCDDCGWHKDYDDSKRAERALNTHKSIHCPSKSGQKVMELNGHVN